MFHIDHTRHLVVTKLDFSHTEHNEKLTNALPASLLTCTAMTMYTATILDACHARARRVLADEVEIEPMHDSHTSPNPS